MRLVLQAIFFYELFSSSVPLIFSFYFRATHTMLLMISYTSRIGSLYFFLFNNLNFDYEFQASTLKLFHQLLVGPHLLFFFSSPSPSPLDILSIGVYQSFHIFFRLLP